MINLLDHLTDLVYALAVATTSGNAFEVSRLVFEMRHVLDQINIQKEAV